MRMHNKFHTLLVEPLTEPLDSKQRDILLKTLERIASFVGEQYQRYMNESDQLAPATGK